jgi:hypothetical protein
MKCSTKCKQSKRCSLALTQLLLLLLLLSHVFVVVFPWRVPTLFNASSAAVL